MAIYDLFSDADVRRAISPVSVGDNTAQNSEIIDTRGYDQVAFLIALGSIADADATFAVTITHGDASNLSDAAAVGADFLIGSLAGAGFQFDSDNQTRELVYKVVKRYVRITITPSNNAGAALMSAVAVLTGKRDLPA